jgi:GntP family gluconate:H+ symporter
MKTGRAELDQNAPVPLPASRDEGHPRDTRRRALTHRALPGVAGAALILAIGFRTAGVSLSPFALLAVGILVVVAGILSLRLHAFLALVLAGLVVGGLTASDQIAAHAQARNMPAAEVERLASQSVGERVGRAFGNTAGSIGILIALASVVGICLLESGAADKIVRSAVRLVGERRAPFAFSGAGFTLGMPVFFDTVFYLMVPLAKALAARTGRDYGLYVMTMAGGASIAHSLVPPTPGPLYVAAQLKVNMGAAIIAGTLLGAVATVAGLAYAFWVNRRWQVPLRATAEVSLADLRGLAGRDEGTLPSFWLSLLPILLPVGLISGAAALDYLWGRAPAGELAAWQSGVRWAFDRLGNSNVAMALATAVALVTLVRFKKGDHAGVVQSALASGGEIILITAAGGAFGAILQQTGVGEEIQRLSRAYAIPVLPLAFFVTALLRTAQGSATVSMFTAVAMFAGAADPATLGFHPVYLACVIGFGSKVFSWMNDSGFWVVGKMSGMTPGETLRSFSLQLVVMAAAGLASTMLAARLFPLV